MLEISFKKVAAFCLAVTLFMPAAVSAHCLEVIPDTAGDERQMRDSGGLLTGVSADLLEAWVRPATNYPATELGLRLAENAQPYVRDRRFEAFFFFDSDGESVNNAPTGSRAGADMAFSLISPIGDPNYQTGWWTYDPEAGDWTFMPDDSILYAFSSPTVIIIHVPFELLPPDVDWDWRAALAIGEGSDTVGDTVPEGEGTLVGCGPDGENPEERSGLPEEPEAQGETGDSPETTVSGETEGSGEGLPLWVWIAILTALLGGAGLAGWKSAGNRPEPVDDGGDSEDGAGTDGETDTGEDGEGEAPEETDGGSEPEETDGEEISDDTPEPAAAPERVTCDCPTCRMFISIGSLDNEAIGSAANLGQAIRRDTETPSFGVPESKRCLKVAHFGDSRFRRGHFVTTNGSGGDVQRQSFRGIDQLRQLDGHRDVCIWKEVMLVHHGESQTHVKNIIESVEQLIPRAPIEKLVLYYCGGERSLPQREFRRLASNLGRRLRLIPEECRPERVHIWMAPTIEHMRQIKFTKLLLERTGLVSFQGKMKHYSVDQDGNITDHGNEVPDGGQLFGDVPLGRLGQRDIHDAEVYLQYWRKFRTAPLSELRRYRQAIDALREHARENDPRRRIDDPPLHPKEAKAADIERLLDEANLPRFSDEEMDRLVEQPNREIRRALRDHERAHR